MPTETDNVPEAAPESLTETVSARVTASERRDLIMVAALDGTDISKLLRSRSINDILARAQQVREAHKAVA